MRGKSIAIILAALLLSTSLHADGIINGGSGGGAPTGSAGGGLAGTYPNPTVATVPASALPALTGDVTSSAGSAATTVAKVNGNTPGGSCTNQVVTSISTSAVPGCANVPTAALPTGQYPGTATNDNASAGNVGEYVSSSILIGSAVSVSNGVVSNLTSLSLTAGDWNVGCSVVTNQAGSTVLNTLEIGISTTSATLPTRGSNGSNTLYNAPTASPVAGSNLILQTGITRESLASTTTVYCPVGPAFTTSTMSVYGYMWARRAR